MSSTVLWYKISPQSQRDRVRIEEQKVHGDILLHGARCVTTLEDRLFLGRDGKLYALRLRTNEGFTLWTEFEQSVNADYQHLSTFWLGGYLHLLAYRQEDGIFDFYRVKDESFEHIHRFQRTYGDTTEGFTTVHAYAYRNSCLFMAYSATTGVSRIYEIQVPPHTSMAVKLVWENLWSEQWRYFCFFTLGLENFFFKINQLRKTVNIDHYQNDPTQGSYAVCSKLPSLPNVNAAVSLLLTDGPGFATYSTKENLLTINRFNSDCSGWTTQGQCTIASGSEASLLAITSTKSETLLALY